MYITNVYVDQNGNDVIVYDDGSKKIVAKGGNDFLNTTATKGPNGDTTLTGSESNDILNGGNGNDTLNGGAGSDILIGGNGNDIGNGGTGSDLYLAGRGDDVGIFSFADQSAGQLDYYNGGSGSDKLKIIISNDELNSLGITAQQLQTFFTNTAASNSLVDFRSLGINLVVRNFESLQIDNGGTITGTSGNDTLTGTSGNDIFVVGGTTGGGNDTILGGSGTDTISYTADTTGITIDLATSSVTGTQVGTDTFTGIETILGGTGNDTLILGTTSGSITSVDLKGGTDTLNATAITSDVSYTLGAGTFSDGLATITVANAENILLGSGANTIDAGVSASGIYNLDFSSNALQTINLQVATSTVINTSWSSTGSNSLLLNYSDPNDTYSFDLMNNNFATSLTSVAVADGTPMQQIELNLGVTNINTGSYNIAITSLGNAVSGTNYFINADTGSGKLDVTALTDNFNITVDNTGDAKLSYTDTNTTGVTLSGFNYINLGDGANIFAIDSTNLAAVNNWTVDNTLTGSSTTLNTLDLSKLTSDLTVNFSSTGAKLNDTSGKLTMVGDALSKLGSGTTSVSGALQNSNHNYFESAAREKATLDLSTTNVNSTYKLSNETVSSDLASVVGKNFGNIILGSGINTIQIDHNLAAVTNIDIGSNAQNYIQIGTDAEGIQVLSGGVSGGNVEVTYDQAYANTIITLDAIGKTITSTDVSSIEYGLLNSGINTINIASSVATFEVANNGSGTFVDGGATTINFINNDGTFGGANFQFDAITRFSGSAYQLTSVADSSINLALSGVSAYYLADNHSNMLFIDANNLAGLTGDTINLGIAGSGHSNSVNMKALTTSMSVDLSAGMYRETNNADHVFALHGANQVLLGQGVDSAVIKDANLANFNGFKLNFGGQVGETLDASAMTAKTTFDVIHQTFSDNAGHVATIESTVVPDNPFFVSIVQSPTNILLGAGDDTVIQGGFLLSGHHFDGGAGINTLDYSHLSTGGSFIDLTQGFATIPNGLNGATVTDTFANFQNILGTNGNDVITTSLNNLTNNPFGNVFEGNGGADTYIFQNLHAIGQPSTTFIHDFSADGDKIDVGPGANVTFNPTLLDTNGTMTEGTDVTVSANGDVLAHIYLQNVFVASMSASIDPNTGHTILTTEIPS